MQASDLIARIAVVMKTCGEEVLMSHLGVVLYEYLGEEYPEVRKEVLFFVFSQRQVGRHDGMVYYGARQALRTVASHNEARRAVLPRINFVDLSQLLPLLPL